MRIFEVIAIIAVLSVFFIRNSKLVNKPNIRFYLSLAGLAVIVLHIIADGLIIQMIYFYLLALGMLLSEVLKQLRKQEASKKKKGIIRGTGITAALLLGIPGVALPFLFQTPPGATGPYAAASVLLEWVDTSRDETFTPDTEDKRDLPVTVWYPCSKKTVTADINGTKKNVKQISDAQDKFPILIFSHGFGMNVGNYGVLLKEIASHGYVIFAVDHPYEASVSVYPDNRVVEISKEVQNSLKGSEMQEANQLIDQFRNETDQKKKDQLFLEYDEATDKISENSVKIWTEDTEFVLNKIEELSKSGSSGLFGSSLDMDRVGAFGHSFGGAISALVCLSDKRVDAGINMDGFEFGQVRYSKEGAITQPFMEMTSEDGIPGFNDYLYSRSESVMYRLHVNGARHNNFADTAMYMPLLRQSSMLNCGPIRPARMYRIVADYSVAFFDQYLKGKSTDILENPKAYPEIDLIKE